MKNLLFYNLLIITLILNACKNRVLDPVEADRSMKVLNSNLINLLSTGSDKQEYRALRFLLGQTSTPLPFVKKINPTQPDTTVYSLDKEKGVYQWNSALKMFEKLENSEIVSLRFPTEKSEKNIACFDLNKFQSQAYSSRPDFPTEIEASLKIGEVEIVSIRHNARITNNLPEHISTLIKGTDYQAGLELNRTQLNKEGKLSIDIFLRTKGIEIISGKIDAQIEYSRHSYFLKIINFDLKLIDHMVKGKINYSAVDPTSADYISSFNSNSSIVIFEGRNQVGKIVLNKTNNSELLDYFIRFQNGNELLLSQYLPILKNLLNLKY